jgi:hypothetical protein
VYLKLDVVSGNRKITNFAVFATGQGSGCPVYRWDATIRSFRFHQNLDSPSAISVKAFNFSGVFYLLVGTEVRGTLISKSGSASRHSMLSILFLHHCWYSTSVMNSRYLHREI